ncbi:MAG: Hsp70 family protein [Acidimicrobiales bacterium]
MSYRLGVDLGTAYSSAAVAVDGRARIVPLGNRSAVLPSVVLLRPDGAVLVGEAADRRGMAEPDRVAREFKRRFGDPTPFDLGGTKLLAEQLMGQLLVAIYRATVEREGTAPDRLALTHPAMWGSQKRQVLLRAVQEAAAEHGLALPPIMLVSEPEAAAIYYAESEHIALGEVVAVYDLGGGTFDAALLRRSTAGFEPMGPPEGIDRLGGVDFDAAVYSHVNRFLDGAIDRLDLRDPAVAAGVARLRADCVEAKEALSADTDVTIAVLLPGLRTELRLTRPELESMIRPALQDTLGALQRAMRSAHVVPADVRVVLLVGGSSRIPLVAQLVGAAVGRPVAVDVHPKHAVALGAALAADAAARLSGPPLAAAGVGPAPPPPNLSTGPPPSPSAGPPPGSPAGTPAAPSVTPSVTPPARGPGGSPRESPSGPPANLPNEMAPALVARPGGSPRPLDGSSPPPSRPAGPRSAATGGSGAAGSAGTGDAAARGEGGPGRAKRVALVGAVLVLVAVLVGVAVVLLGGDDPGSARATASDANGSGQAGSDSAGSPSTGSLSTGSTPTPATPTTTRPTAPATSPTTSPPAVVDPASLPLPEDCQDRPSPFVCALAVHFDEDGQLVVPFRTQGYVADISARHIHFFFPNHPEIAEDPNNAGTGGTKHDNNWILWDDPNPFGGPTAYGIEAVQAAQATEICVLVADPQHRVLPNTGNCLPLPT